MSFLQRLDCHPVHLLFLDAELLGLIVLGFLKDSDYFRAALRHLLSNNAKVQISVIGLVLVAVVDDLPFLDAIPGISSGADILLGVAVGKVDIVGLKIAYATVLFNIESKAIVGRVEIVDS